MEKKFLFQILMRLLSLNRPFFGFALMRNSSPLVLQSFINIFTDLYGNQILLLMLLNAFPRSGSSNGSSGANKLEAAPLSASPSPRMIQKTELEKVSLSRDHTAGLNKERLIAKGNNKYVSLLQIYLTKIKLLCIWFFV